MSNVDQQPAKQSDGPTLSLRNAEWLLPAALVLLLGVTLASFELHHLSSLALDKAAADQSVIEHTTNLFIALDNAETGQRGFLLTGQPEYLQPFDNGSRQAASEVEALLQVTRLMPAEYARAQELKRLQEIKFAELALTIRLFKVSGSKAALNVVKTGEGKLTMDHIRILCQKITSGAYKRSIVYSASGQSYSELAFIDTVVGAISLMILLLISLILTRKATAQLDRHIDKLTTQSLLLNQTNESIFIRDSEDRITYWNRGAQLLYGWSQHEALGQVTHALLKTRFPRSLSEIQQQLLAQGHWKGELEHTRRDGSLVMVESNWTLQRNKPSQLASVFELNLNIGDRKKAEERQELLVALIDGATDYGIFMLNPTGHIVTWNRGAERVNGYSEGEIVGQHFSIFYPLDALTADLPENELRTARATGKFVDEGWRLRRDGSTFWASIVITAIYDNGGKLRGFSKLTRDITERKNTEGRFQLVVEASPSAMIMLGADGLMTLVNSQTEKLFGFDRHELLGKPIEMLLPDRFRRHHGGHITDFFAAPSARAMGKGRDLYALRKDGSEVPVEIGLNPIDAAGGQFVLASVIDITERKRAASALRDQALMLDLANDSVTIRDGHDRITYWNQGAERLYGWTKEEALGQVLHVLFKTQFPEPLEDIQKQLYSNGYWKGELLHTRKDGCVITVASNWTLKRDEANGLPSILAINSDITAAKKARQEADERTAQLKAVNQELEQFAYAASHDLKAPLRVIDNASKWLEEDLEQHLTQETREHLALMRSRVKRMDKLLDDLLQYARIGRAIDNRYQETVNGKSLVYDVLALLPMADFTITVDPAFSEIQVCRMPLQHIFMNLIGNAIKHHHRKVGCIAITVEDTGGNYCFAVKDDGPGIAEQFHTSIFKMFQTLKPRDQVEGSGMGLAMARKSIEVFGGTLQVESAEGQGSTFRFTWPKIQQQPKREAA